MPLITHDGVNFDYQDAGRGIPFFFQHGLGADSSQPFSVFRPPRGFRLLAFDCRAHGETRPLGDPDKISVPSFADDLLGLMNYLRIPRAIVGGISMGAAIALHFTLSYPDRVLGLVLSRPAWLDTSRADNVQIFQLVAQLIREHGAKRGSELFRRTEEYRQVFRKSPDNAISLLGQFEQPRAEETVIKLERIPYYVPTYTREHWKAISVPTLVLANRQDPIHPFEYGETLARIIPGAAFTELTPKSVSLERHNADVQHALAEFLNRSFAVESLRR
jgi:pimeloyl-ACP methyl ester carboxylesterase